MNSKLKVPGPVQVRSSLLRPNSCQTKLRARRNRLDNYPPFVKSQLPVGLGGSLRGLFGLEFSQEFNSDIIEQDLYAAKERKTTSPGQNLGLVIVEDR